MKAHPAIVLSVCVGGGCGCVCVCVGVCVWGCVCVLCDISTNLGGSSYLTYVNFLPPDLVVGAPK